MKRDIRPLFKDTTVHSKRLPEDHRQEFINKLGETKNRKPIPWLKIAALLVTFLAVGYAIITFGKEDSSTQQLEIAQQIEAVEQEYLKDIEKEWKRFVAIANDDVLVARFKKKLDDLDKNYQIISVQFKEDSNNILIIETLVENLQTRLKLLKDIQQHIEILNQNNEQHEQTI